MSARYTSTLADAIHAAAQNIQRDAGRECVIVVLVADVTGDESTIEPMPGDELAIAVKANAPHDLVAELLEIASKQVATDGHERPAVPS